jgi:hypothetical protein
MAEHRNGRRTLRGAAADVLASFFEYWRERCERLRAAARGCVPPPAAARPHANNPNA